jgi:predicted nucleic acid-binding Zn ribbon protein
VSHSVSLQQILQQGKFDSQFNSFSNNVLTKLKLCRTAAMGYHQYRCQNTECNHIHYQYHGCRNRHCPVCNRQKQEQWMEERINELLPVKYYHVVFTLPHELNSLVMGNRTVLFKQLFDSAAHTLLTLSRDPKWLGALPSITAVLHTWGQQLSFHPHLHCILSGGGIDKNMNWCEPRNKTVQGYLFPYKVMEPLFKKHFLRNANRMLQNGEIKADTNVDWKKVKDFLYKKEWIVYAKSPMGNAGQVVEYLARYAYKVAISNHRILDIMAGKVTFAYKDYSDSNKQKIMSLSLHDFVQRFEQHILPRGFVKMRHYGILGNFNRKKRINQILAKMNLPPHPPSVAVPYSLRMLEKYAVDVSLCPKCKASKMVLQAVCIPNNRGSPGIKPHTDFYSK